MTAFGPFNFHQPGQSPQWLREVHERQHQRWLDNLKAGYWTEQQHRKQQLQGAQQLGALQKRPSLPAGQPGDQVPQHLSWRPARARTGLLPAAPPRVRKEQGGCVRAIGGLCLFLFLGFCVSQAVIPLFM